MIDGVVRIDSARHGATTADALFIALAKLGIHVDVARYLVNRYPEERIRRQFAALPYRRIPRQKTQAQVLTEAIQLNRALPREYREATHE